MEMPNKTMPCISMIIVVTIIIFVLLDIQNQVVDGMKRPAENQPKDPNAAGESSKKQATTLNVPQMNVPQPDVEKPQSYLRNNFFGNNLKLHNATPDEFMSTVQRLTGKSSDHFEANLSVISQHSIPPNQLAHQQMISFDQQPNILHKQQPSSFLRQEASAQFDKRLNVPPQALPPSQIPHRLQLKNPALFGVDPLHQKMPQSRMNVPQQTISQIPPAGNSDGNEKIMNRLASTGIMNAQQQASNSPASSSSSVIDPMEMISGQQPNSNHRSTSRYGTQMITQHQEAHSQQSKVAVPSFPSSCVTVNPEVVIFKWNETLKRWISEIHIENHGSTQQHFEVECTHKDKFSIPQANGVLVPKQKTTILVALQLDRMPVGSKLFVKILSESGESPTEWKLDAGFDQTALTISPEVLLFKWNEASKRWMSGIHIHNRGITKHYIEVECEHKEIFHILPTEDVLLPEQKTTIHLNFKDDPMPIVRTKFIVIAHGVIGKVPAKWELDASFATALKITSPDNSISPDNDIIYFKPKNGKMTSKIQINNYGREPQKFTVNSTIGAKIHINPREGVLNCNEKATIKVTFESENSKFLSASKIFVKASKIGMENDGKATTIWEFEARSEEDRSE